MVDFFILKVEYVLNVQRFFIYCKRELDDYFFFFDKIGGCSSDYLLFVVYSSLIVEEFFRRGEKEFIFDGRLNVYLEVGLVD